MKPVLDHLQVRAEVVRVIPNAIELADCDRPGVADQARGLRHRVGLQPDDLLFVSVGRLEANKGFSVLVRALAILVKRHVLPQRWRWVLAGDGPMRGDLKSQAVSAGIGEQVVLCGRIGTDELHGWYEAATLFVHPTLYEGSSLVTLEAMAHRRAVVATRAGGLPDKVIPGGNGWLVPPGNTEALADALHTALSDRRRLSMMGEAGRALVEREFSWAVATDRLLVAYRDLLARVGSL